MRVDGAIEHRIANRPRHRMGPLAAGFRSARHAGGTGCIAPQAAGRVVVHGKGPS